MAPPSVSLNLELIVMATPGRGLVAHAPIGRVTGATLQA
jgi:hypothetical protein